MFDSLDVIDYLADVSFLWPGVLLSALVALWAGSAVGRRVGGGRVAGTLFVFAVGGIVSATLTPSREALRFGALGSGTCDLARIQLVSLDEMLSFGDAGFNVFLYVPLGIALGLLPGRWPSLGWLAAGALLSPGVELTQLIFRSLDRACQASDMLNNETGLLFGIAIGLVAHALLRGQGLGPPQTGGEPPFHGG
jgi:VanZ like family